MTSSASLVVVDIVDRRSRDRAQPLHWTPTTYPATLADLWPRREPSLRLRGLLSLCVFPVSLPIEGALLELTTLVLRSAGMSVYLLLSPLRLAFVLRRRPASRLPSRDLTFLSTLCRPTATGIFHFLLFGSLCTSFVNYLATDLYRNDRLATKVRSRALSINREVTSFFCLTALHRRSHCGQSSFLMRQQ